MKHCPVCARSFPPEERFCSIHGLPLVGGDSRTEQKGEHPGIVLDDRYLLGGMVGRGGMGIVVGRREPVLVGPDRRSSDGAPRRETIRWIGASPLSPNVSIPVPDLSELARSRQDDIVKAVLDALFEAFPRFHAVDRQVLRRRVAASHVIGVPIDNVASLVEGLPFDEFAEQLRFHGEVGLRKLRIHFKGQGQRTVFVKGKPFEGAGGEQLGTLFVVDDVTEREQVIESLGRYLSKDVVERVLTRAGPTEPEVRQRRAVVLAVRMDHDGSMFDRLDPEGVLGVFGGIVRAVSQAIFPRGGGIERISHDGCLAFFARVGVSCAPALEAAVDLAARLEQIRARLVAVGEPGPAWRLGLHLGDVLVLNAGDEHLMAQTIAGEVTRAAEALCAVAGGGEVLISSELLACADVPFTFVAGPDVSVAGRDGPLRSHRLVPGAGIEVEDEPVTATTRPPTPES
jgi:class 3 adenylate cyclase